jgi:hypothetical protein
MHPDRRGSVLTWCALLAVAVVGGCGPGGLVMEDAGTLDAAVADAGRRSDGAVSDASRPESDAATPTIDSGADAGCVRCGDAAGALDAASADAWVATPDAGADGGAVPDAGPPPDTTPVVQLALGTTHTCALRSSGRVMCWGNPSFLGWPAPALLDATEIAAVANDTYARRRDGTVVRWRGTGGALTVVADMPPDPVMPMARYAPGESFPLPTGDYVEIYGTDTNACGRRMNGSIWCWGQNQHGQLARETGELTETGYAYPAGEALMGGARMNATTIGVYAFHRCAVLADGRVVCWGSNSEGQLGRWVSGLESVEPVEPEWY